MDFLYNSALARFVIIYYFAFRASFWNVYSALRASFYIITQRLREWARDAPSNIEEWRNAQALRYTRLSWNWGVQGCQ